MTSVRVSCTDSELCFHHPSKDHTKQIISRADKYFRTGRFKMLLCCCAVVNRQRTDDAFRSPAIYLSIFISNTLLKGFVFTLLWQFVFLFCQNETDFSTFSTFTDTTK